MPTRRLTLADLSPGRSDISALILRRGQTEAEAAMRSGDIWANAAASLGQIGAGAIEKRRDEKAQEAVHLATSPRYPSATKPVPGSESDVPDPGEDHIQAILGRIDPARRPQVQASIEAIDASRAKAESTRLDLQTRQKKLAQEDADVWYTLSKGLEQHMDDADGGIAAADIGVGRVRGVPGQEKIAELAAGYRQAFAEAPDEQSKARVVEEWRHTVTPLIQRGSAGGSLEAQKSWADLQAKLRPETETITTTNPDGSTTQQIVKKEPGRTFTSSPKPEPIGSFGDFVVKKYGRNATPEQIAEARKVYGQADDRAININGMGGLYSDIDPRAIADAIERGEQPPVITDLGKPAGAAVSSELAKRGFNLAKAATDWKATQRHISSMNGPQQLRLNQSINALPELLDTVDGLAEQWKGGKFPVLNKANLALAKGGAYGKDAAVIANKLDAQIADVVADLGNVYMGGNSPTDHALSLAGKSLSGDWDEKVLREMVKMAKVNVTIRRNSIQNTGVSGASAGNPYQTPPPPAAAPAARPRATNPQTGEAVEWDGNAWVKAP